MCYILLKYSTKKKSIQQKTKVEDKADGKNMNDSTSFLDKYSNLHLALFTMMAFLQDKIIVWSKYDSICDPYYFVSFCVAPAALLCEVIWLVLFPV